VTNSQGRSVAVVIDDSSKVGDARRRTLGLALDLRFDESGQGKAALLATEAATNLLKHAGGGTLIVQGFDFGQDASGLEVLAIDSGQGISDIGQCETDGYSTAGSPGNGMGAMRRLADSFEIYSDRGSGTVVRARLNRSARPADGIDGMELGVVQVAAPGEDVCGDAWAVTERDGRHFVLLVDGLGHGLPAAGAAQEAVRVFRGHTAQEPEQMIESLHEALRSTRGAALAIARLDRALGVIDYAGVGNICGVGLNLRTGAITRMISQNGTVGYAIRKIQVFRYPWSEDSLLIMHSDGLAGHWDLGRYPGLGHRHPSLVGGVLYRDYKRGRDDVTVVASRERPGRS
jgi:anti-sigma regulatory factor (Ser/Thr protein kinase)